MLQLDKSFVSLDLGGGSTQITFAPKSNHIEGLDGRKHFMHEVNILQNMIKVRKKKMSYELLNITTNLCFNANRRVLYYL